MLRIGWLRRLFGNRGESLAVRHLQQQGYRILSRQMRNRFGEVDIVAMDGECLVFVEVKTRQSTARGRPEEAVTADKQRRITRAALAWMKSQRQLDRRCRFDVVAITWRDHESPAIEHIQHAFEAAGGDSLYG